MNRKNAFRGLLALAVVLAMILPFTISQADYFYSSLNIQSFGVRNTSRGEYSFNSQTSANAGEQLEFSLSVTNYSGTTIRNTALQVNLPSGLNVSSNYVTVDGYNNNSNLVNRIYLGDIYSGSSKQVVFRANVNSNTYNNSYTVYAYASGDNASSVSSSVTINSNNNNNNNCYESYGYNYNYNCYNNNNLRLSVLGRNISRGGDLVKNFSAQPGDTIEFSLRVSTDSGNTVRNVYLSDTLDNYLEFISGTVRSDGSYASDSLINSGGLFVGDLYSGNYRTVTFQAKVAPDYRFPQRGIIVSNTAQVRADNTTLVSDSSSLTVTNYVYYNTPTPTPYPTYPPRYYSAPTPIIIYRTVPAPTPIIINSDQNVGYVNNPDQTTKDKLDPAIHLNDFGVIVFVLLIVVLILLFMLWRMDRNRLEEALRNR